MMWGMYRRPLAVWVVLVLATLASGLVTNQPDAVKIGATAVILIAAIKINMVVSQFMELKWHHRPWRLVLAVWLGVVTAIIIGGYWIS